MDPDLDTVIRQAPALPIPPAINPKDITRHLEQRHRDAMLDLVLAWGTMDGALVSVRGLYESDESVIRRPLLKS